MQLFFRKSGQGRPLIILHGLFGSSDNWVSVSKSLSEQFEVFVVDQRNHGRSPHDLVHSYDLMAKDLVEFISEHNLVEPFLLGHSMGGKTAMTLALTYPGVIQKLIVVDIAPKYYRPHHQDVIAGLQSIDLSTLKSREEAEELMKANIPEFGVRQFLLKNLYRNDSGGFSWRMNLGIIVDQIENIGKANEGLTFLKPTLFIRGENSNYISDNDIELIDTLFPDNRLKTISGSGHWVQAEKPIEFVKEVITFLNH